ncbi:MAG: hypothetical protein IJ688_04075 [Treponema sp.]|nr:hypothetical protein [Treponema sp.]
MEDLDEETRAQRKKEQIEYRNRKKTSTIFMLAASAFEIIETLVIIIALFVLMSFLVFKVLDANQPWVQLLFQISLIVIFIGGIVLGFFIYKKVMKWAIKKFKLEDILLDDVKRHYIKPTEDEIEMELKR